MDDSVEILYQKLGERWFAFSVVNGEVFWGSVDEKEIESAAMSSSYHNKLPRHSWLREVQLHKVNDRNGLEIFRQKTIDLIQKNPEKAAKILSLWLQGKKQPKKKELLRKKAA